MNPIEAYTKGWKAIVQPPRFKYTIFDLGSPYQSFTPHPRLTIDNMPNPITIVREDFEVKNPKNHTLQCSFYRAEGDLNQDRPCLVYLHAHGSSRLGGMEVKNHFLPKFSVCLFDFSGCGLSEGEYITLGLKERDDVQTVLKALQTKYGLRYFFLYGRSMGAVSALLYSHKFVCGGDGYISGYDDPARGVLGIALDSPFTKAKSTVSYNMTSI